MTDTATAPAVGGRSAEFWGYLLWGLAALAIAVPELAAVFRAGWPTISNTVGHLESENSFVRVIVVFLIAVLAYYTVPQLTVDPAQPMVLRGQHVTANGRITRDTVVRYVNLGGYLVLALGSLVVGVAFAIAARQVHPGTYVGAYVLYGLIALMWVIVPTVLSQFFGREVPFPTLFRTLAYLDRRAHPMTAVILGLLAVLLIHLALYPWPRFNS